MNKTKKQEKYFIFIPSIYNYLYMYRYIGTLLSGGGGQERHVFEAGCLLPFLVIRSGAN